jgi:hypothetical protein
MTQDQKDMKKQIERLERAAVILFLCLATIELTVVYYFNNH